MKKTSPLSYTFAVGRIKALEKFLIKSEVFEEAVELDMPEALRLFVESDLYSEELLQKHRILVANKMDLPDAKKNLTKFKRKVTKDIIPISAKEKEGLDKLLATIRLLL